MGRVTRCRPSVCAAIAGAVLALSGAAAHAQSYTLTDLSTFGGTQSVAWGINDNGQVSGWARNSAGNARAFRWTDGVLTDIGVLASGNESVGYAINNSGVVAGRSLTSGASTNHAFSWNGTTMSDLSTLGGSTSEAWGINSSGQVVGRSTVGSVERAFRYSGGVMSQLGTGTLAQGSFSYAYGINDSGHVVGYASTNNQDNNMRAFRWTGSGNLIDMGTMGGSQSWAYDINTSGQITGGASVAGDDEHAFRWTSGAFEDLGTLGTGIEAEGWGINDSGTIVGYSTTVGSNNPHAFVATGGSLIDLNNLIAPGSGWVLTHARDINNSGQIVGGGTFNSQVRAWLLTPIPAWANASGGGWATAGNWSPATVPAVGGDAIFNLASVAGYTVTFDAATSIGNISVQTDKPTFNLGGNTLTASGAVNLAPTNGQTGQLSISTGTLSAAGVFVGGSSAGTGGAGILNVGAAATLSVAGTLKVWNTPDTQVTLNGGIISAGAIDTDGNPARFMGNGTTTGWISGTVEITNSSPVIGASGPFGPSLTLGAGKTLRIKSGSKHVTIEAGSTLDFSGGTLDLTDKKLIAVNGDVGSWNGSYTGLTGQIQSGYNGGGWDGGGIVTSMPDALISRTTLAIATAEQAGYAGGTFGGVPVSSEDVLVMYTYAGDANLSGTIDPDDYALLSFNDNIPGTTGYYNGDFNYDGDINADDFALIDFNFNAQGAPFPTGAVAEVIATAGSVPEPSAPLIATVAAFAIIARRRRGECG